MDFKKFTRDIDGLTNLLVKSKSVHIIGKYDRFVHQNSEVGKKLFDPKLARSSQIKKAKPTFLSQLNNGWSNVKKIIIESSSKYGRPSRHLRIDHKINQISEMLGK